MKNYKKIKEVLLEIPNDKPIYIAGHKNPDMDSISSALALTRYLNTIGKTAKMLLEKKELNKIKWFDDLSYIVEEVLEDNYVFIMVDCSEKGRLGIYEKKYGEASLKMSIDHHENRDTESDYILSIEGISSTAEIIYNLLSLFEIKLNKKIAELLYSGIITDTLCFFQRTTPNTLTVAAGLLEYNIDYNYIIKKVFLNKTEEEAIALGEMLKTIKYDVFHYVIVDKSENLYKNIPYHTISKKLSLIIRTIDEIKVLGIFVIENNKISGTFKSNCEIDVDALATQLGGGGHKKQAGFKSNLDIEAIIEISKRYITNFKKNE